MEEELFVVVKNHEDQYSIWASGRPLPAGWDAQSGPETKEQCLAYINIHWVDMTPASLKRGAPD